jgi:thiol oxidase
LGCRGSQAQFGGYPCGLWSLWHTLTLAQAAAATRLDPRTGPSDPKEVLMAMKGFIQEFFGCRDCARHFDQTIEQV